MLIVESQSTMGVTADDLLTLVPLLYAVPALFIYTAIILGMLRLEGTFYRLLAINGIYVSLLYLVHKTSVVSSLFYVLV